MNVRVSGANAEQAKGEIGGALAKFFPNDKKPPAPPAAPAARKSPAKAAAIKAKSKAAKTVKLYRGEPVIQDSPKPQCHPGVFFYTETRLGILPAVISPFVVANIGETHARALFPGGRRIDAVRAQRIGLVHEVVEGEAALDTAVISAVDDVLESGPHAVRAAKAIVREVRGLGHG